MPVLAARDADACLVRPLHRRMQLADAPFFITAVTHGSCPLCRYGTDGFALTLIGSPAGSTRLRWLALTQLSVALPSVQR